ncbi:hypothetical protein Gotur_027964 [Gossypium turneri]
MIPVVQEFYLELKQREASKPFYEMRSFVKVRVVNVPVTEIEGKEMWTYRTGTTISKTFNLELIMPSAKMWIKFVCLRIWPIIEISDVSPTQAIKTYGILQKKQICIGTWIYRNMVDCARNLGVDGFRKN